MVYPTTLFIKSSRLWSAIKRCSFSSSMGIFDLCTKENYRPCAVAQPGTFYQTVSGPLPDGDTRRNVEYFFLDSQVFKDVTRRTILIFRTTWKVNFPLAKRITNG